MKKTNNYLFTGLTIVAWLIFVGLCIEAGGLLVNFIFSLSKPEMVQNLYQKLDFSEMYARSEGVFFTVYSFILGIAILKAILFYIVVLLVTKIDLQNPFNNFVSKQILLISYLTFSIGILGFIGQEIAIQLQENEFLVDNISDFWSDSQAFILMAAVIYMIATIFKKGIELQNENDLTI